MKEMTNQDAEYWDNYYTENTIMPDLSKPGYFSRKYGMTITLDTETSNVLSSYAEKLHKTPAKIISELVQKEIIPTLA
jgi:hypothetical protein